MWPVMSLLLHVYILFSISDAVEIDLYNLSLSSRDLRPRVRILPSCAYDEAQIHWNLDQVVDITRWARAGTAVTDRNEYSGHAFDERFVDAEFRLRRQRLGQVRNEVRKRFRAVQVEAVRRTAQFAGRGALIECEHEGRPPRLVVCQEGDTIVRASEPRRPVLVLV